MANIFGSIGAALPVKRVGTVDSISGNRYVVVTESGGYISATSTVKYSLGDRVTVVGGAIVDAAGAMPDAKIYHV